MSELFIDTVGHGDAHVVMLHGWAMHGGIFAPLIEALQDRCTLHVVDLPGHGRSRHCAVTLEPRACAAAIVARTPPATWMGWSLGGLIALTGALQRTEHVRGLALLSSSPRFVRGQDWPHGVDAEVFHQFGRDLDDDYHGTLNRFLALEAMGSEHARTQMRRLRKNLFIHGEPDKLALKQGLALLERVDLRAQVEALTRPSVWIAGARDRLVPWQAMSWGAEQCNGEFARIEHAGHAAFIGFAGAVVEALQPLLARAAA